MKGKDTMSDSVAVIIGKAKPKGDAATEKPADAGKSALGAALRKALESKDDAALCDAVCDIVEYHQPDPVEETEE